MATVALATSYRQREVRDLITLSEENNVALAQVFSNTLWLEYGPFLSSTETLSNEELINNPVILKLQADVLGQFESLSVVKVKIYDLQGRTIFSNDFSQIGDDKSQSFGFRSAKSGQVLSQLGHRDTFKALQMTLEDLHVFSSYIPIYDAGSRTEVVAVFELYTDVTPLLNRIDIAQRNVVLWSLGTLGSLYIVLCFFVSRADALLAKQYQQVQASEERYRQQANELEHALRELQRTQAQIVQSEKMSSLGQLVAGVAHEINNPVTFIYSNIGYVRDYAKDLLSLIRTYQSHCSGPALEFKANAIDLDFIREDLPKTLTSMEVGSNRIREIVLSLRNFSRLDEAEIKRANIHQGLDDTLMILGHRLKACPERPAIQVKKEYAELPSVECYAGLLNQVFMNILSNAIDALENTMSAQKEQSDSADPACITLRTTQLNEKWVQIAIANNGHSIPQEVQQRIFEPFFTTKSLGKGTGMGMSISYQIVAERHKGKLFCFSAPDQETEFVIQIPLRQKDQGV
ncbi:MAG: sensor histidine kinase [Leptolyngbyaceae cyanobacterium]